MLVIPGSFGMFPARLNFKGYNQIFSSEHSISLRNVTYILSNIIQYLFII